MEYKTKIDYEKLCYRLEGKVDEAIRLLRTVAHPKAKKASKVLIKALRETEEQIIRERDAQNVTFVSFADEAEKDSLRPTLEQRM